MKTAISKITLIAACCAACAIVTAGKLEIISATYGAEDSQVDVKKKIIESGVVGDFIAIDVSNALVPKDPAHGKAKFLTIKYKEDGKEKTAVYKERSKAIIAPGVKPTKELTVLKAFYGAKDKWINVIDQVKEAIKNKTTIEASNATFKQDPLRGLMKYLIILYSKDDKLHVKIIPEKTKFSGASM